MAFDALTFSPILAPLEAGDTVTVPYPAGRSASDYTNGATGEHYGLIYGGRYDLDPTFGASNITFDWDYERVPVGSRIALQFERIAPPATLDEAATRTLSNVNAAVGRAALAAAKTDMSDVDLPEALENLGLGNVDDTADADKPISTATQAALDDKQPLAARLTAITAADDTVSGVLYPVGGEENSGFYGVGAGKVGVAADGVLGFQVWSPDGVNHYFGSPLRAQYTTVDGVHLGACMFDADNKYLNVAGLVGAKDDNAWNDGGYRYNGPQDAVTKVAKYDVVRISWAIGSRDGRMAPSSGGYGRCAQISYVAAEDQTNTASGGVLALSATPLGTHAQPTQAWVHGPTESFVVAGKAWASIANVVDYGGFAAETTYMVNVGTQAAKAFRDVSSTGRGIDYGWNTSTNRFYGYSVASSTRAVMFSYDPANGNQRHGTNEDLLFLDNANSRIYINRTAQIASEASKLQVSRAGGQCASFQRLTDDGGCITFYGSNSANVGSISVSTTATAYNITSDYRAKRDVEPLTGAVDRLMALKPSRFRFNVNPDAGFFDGFIAHEVQEVCPQAVTGDKDGEEMQAMDASKLIPMLTSALQEALARIEALEAGAGHARPHPRRSARSAGR